MSEKPPIIESMTPFGGGYKGSNADLHKILHHAVSQYRLKIGRIIREPGEAFCNKALYNEDFYGYGDASKIDCPRCKSIIEREAEQL